MPIMAVVSWTERVGIVVRVRGVVLGASTNTSDGSRLCLFLIPNWVFLFHDSRFHFIAKGRFGKARTAEGVT